MESTVSVTNPLNKQPLEIDVRKILEQMGIEMSKWPKEYKQGNEQTDY
jgi:hypothetical protein